VKIPIGNRWQRDRLGIAAVAATLARILCSTIGGTRPVSVPPSCAFRGRVYAQVAVGFAGSLRRVQGLARAFAVHQRHLQFHIHIRDGANAAKDHGGVALAGVVPQVALEYSTSTFGHCL